MFIYWHLAPLFSISNSCAFFVVFFHLLQVEASFEFFIYDRYE